MSRIPIVAGNWKMYKTPQESVEFVRELALKLGSISGVEKVVCPPFVSLPGTAAALADNDIAVGAQNVSAEVEGAYTSQVSPRMLQGLVKYVIIGHSECRQYLGETDDLINRKIQAALAHGLKPIFAVGEPLSIRDAGATHEYVALQVRLGLRGVTAEQMHNIVIAYEPIWAIGTGRNASGEDANAVCRDTVRATVRALYGDAVAAAVRIQYGGSVKPNNMAEYMRYPDIDGALVGGASLKVDDFTALVQAAAEAKTA